MKSIFEKMRLALSALRLVPHCAVWLRCGRDSHLATDVRRWTDIYLPGKEPDTRAFIYFMTKFPEFRNLFYYRTGLWGRIFSFLCRPMETLYISTARIGPGLFIQHGFATIIAAKEIGRNCWINQQVTIGFSNATDAPTIGDNVTIHAGAKVIGAVQVGSNTKVGANAVVVKDLPPNCTAVGVPAYVVKRDGKRVRNYRSAA